MMNAKEYAKKSGLHLRKVQRLAKEGKIKARKVGRDWIILEKPNEPQK